MTNRDWEPTIGIVTRQEVARLHRRLTFWLALFVGYHAFRIVAEVGQWWEAKQP